ncbi:hypothetical protein FF38_03067, partial [Lucilia cuprina]
MAVYNGKEIPEGISRRQFKKQCKMERMEAEKEDFLERRRVKRRELRKAKSKPRKRDFPEEQTPSGIKCILDCGFDDLMVDGEITSLAAQISKAISRAVCMPPPPHSLVSLEYMNVDTRFKREAEGYKVVFNPNFEPKVDVDLLYSFEHTSVVCCVKFNDEGTLIATGCNRATHVYQAFTGELLCELQDPSVDVYADLYVRSLCFSPCGNFLATGSE